MVGQKMERGGIYYQIHIQIQRITMHNNLPLTFIQINCIIEVQMEPDQLDGQEWFCETDELIV